MNIFIRKEDLEQYRHPWNGDDFIYYQLPIEIDGCNIIRFWYTSKGSENAIKYILGYWETDPGLPHGQNQFCKYTHAQEYDDFIVIPVEAHVE